MTWDDQTFNLRPIVGARGGMRCWPVSVAPIDEPDGGTFYRPALPHWVNGTGEPDPSTGDEDDYYLDTGALEYYGPKGVEDEEGNGEWPGPFSIPGPESVEDWLTGSGDPADGTGVEGDYYLDTSGHAIWGPKGATSWADTGPEFIVDSWVTLVAGPKPQGLFSLPGVYMEVGSDDGSQAVDVWMQLRTADGKRLCADIKIGSMTADFSSEEGTAQALDYAAVFHQFEAEDILTAGTIDKVRFKITGGKGLKWELAGSGITRLHG